MASPQIKKTLQFKRLHSKLRISWTPVDLMPPRCQLREETLESIETFLTTERSSCRMRLFECFRSLVDLPDCHRPRCSLLAVSIVDALSHGNARVCYNLISSRQLTPTHSFPLVRFNGSIVDHYVSRITH